MSDNRSTDEVFEYMGNNQRAQYDVVSVRLHPSVEEICPYVFYRCNSLKMVVLNDGLQTISYQSFNECESLECITLPSTAVEIGSYAFRGCTNLIDVVLN